MAKDMNRSLLLVSVGFLLLSRPCFASEGASSSRAECTSSNDGTSYSGKVGGSRPDECIYPAAKVDILSESVRDEWPSYFKELLPMGARLAALLPEPDDKQLRLELYRNLYRHMFAAYISRLYVDPDHPDFWAFGGSIFNVGGPSPDHNYLLTQVDPKGVYRLSGRRNTVRIVNASIGGGRAVVDGTGPFGATFSDYDFDTLHLGKDGAFEVILSSQRPAGYKGDWWELDAQATHVWIRQIAYDWLHEVDASIAIERLDSPAVRPRATAREIDERLRQIPAWVENYTRRFLNIFQNLHDLGFVNKVRTSDYSSSATGKIGQLYIEGLFDIVQDEALILETEVPRKCRFWNVQLTDELWSSVDWQNRQSSINGYTAKLDKDGKFRAVISAQDPGVPNWLDNMGLKRGMIFGRWLDCDSQPTPVIKKVKFADVRKYLPSDTPSVSPVERDAQIRIRREGAQLRRKW